MSQSNKLLGTGAIVAVAVLLTALVTYAVVRDDSQPATAPEQTTTNQQPAAQPPADADEPRQEPESESSSGDISMDDARRIALERFGGSVTEIKHDTHNDQPTWEIEMINTSEGEIEVDIHRQTGEIIAWERD